MQRNNTASLSNGDYVDDSQYGPALLLSTTTYMHYKNNYQCSLVFSEIGRNSFGNGKQQINTFQTKWPRSLAHPSVPSQ